MSKLASVGLLTLLLSPLLPWPGHTTQTAVQAGLSVRDANNRKVGNVVSLTSLSGGNLPVVLFALNGEIHPIVVGRDNFRRNPLLFFATTDCTGQAYIALDATTPNLPPQPLRLTVVALPGHTIYTETGAAQSVLVGSTLNPVVGCQSFTPFMNNVVPASPLLDLDTVFVPPFTVR